MSDIVDWTTLLLTAFGGAGLGVLGVAFTRSSELRHRHDEESRRHYLEVVDAFDIWNQAVMNATDARNAYAARFVRNGERSEELRAELLATTMATDEPFAAARRAFQLVSFFAPYKVLTPLQEVHDHLFVSFLHIREPLPNPEDFPDALPLPVWPGEAFQKFKEGVRDDLGVRSPWRDRWRRAPEPRDLHEIARQARAGDLGAPAS